MRVESGAQEPPSKRTPARLSAERPRPDSVRPDMRARSVKKRARTARLNHRRENYKFVPGSNGAASAAPFRLGEVEKNDQRNDRHGEDDQRQRDDLIHGSNLVARKLRRNSDASVKFP